MSTCFLWKYVFVVHEEYVAVMTIVGPLQKADLQKLVVRASLVSDDGEYRDAAIQWRAGFFTSLTVTREVKT